MKGLDGVEDEHAIHPSLQPNEHSLDIVSRPASWILFSWMTLFNLHSISEHNWKDVPPKADSPVHLLIRRLTE